MRGHMLRETVLEILLGARFIRALVSKKRRRFVMGSFDLDMSYITDRLVAMSFPSQHIRAVYRNPMWQVKQVLDMKHGSHYKVYNLCAEETYDPEYFHGRLEVIPFDDNHVPPFSLIRLFCESVHVWLSSDTQNVAVIHCMKSGWILQYEGEETHPIIICESNVEFWHKKTESSDERSTL